MSEDWFSAGIDVNFRGEPTGEVLVRAWQAGDGLTCSFANHQKRVDCDRPVAAIRKIKHEKTYKWEAVSITRVVCLRHVATLYGIKATVEDVAVEKAAAEELAERYWDQYQEIVARKRDELLRERLSSLPNELQDKVIELVESGGAA